MKQVGAKQRVVVERDREAAEHQRKRELLERFEQQIQADEELPPVAEMHSCPVPHAEPNFLTAPTVHVTTPVVAVPAASRTVLQELVVEKEEVSTGGRRLAALERKPWEVLLTEGAYQRLLHENKRIRQASIRTLRVLASGHWSETHKIVVGSHGPLKLRQLPCESLVVLWSIDVDFSRELDCFAEVIQVWDIVEEEKAAEARDAILAEWKASRRSWQALTAALKRWKLDVEDSVRLPRVLPRTDLEDKDVATVRKFFTLDENILRSIVEEDDDNRGIGEKFQLRISKQEATICAKPGPVIVIGRSGSGKTLCCVYRMYFQYQQYWERATAAGGEPLLPHGRQFTHFNQIFVTHSASLANKVQEYFSNLLEARAALGQMPVQAPPSAAGGRRVRFLEQGRLPDDLTHVRDFPIFLTFRKFLIMVDGVLSRPFFPRKPGGAVNSDAVDLAMAVDSEDPISALRERRPVQKRMNSGVAPSRSMLLTEVDYDLFVKRFWPKLRQKCPPSCDTFLVWREIQSHIKGSYRVLDTDCGHLSLAQYCEVAKRLSPGFEEHRGSIYKAFTTYEELRKQEHCFDRMDACFHVIQQLRHEPYAGPPIHSGAVDEVQDLAQLELALFFQILSRPFDGLFVTGDTSQTVSRSVDFRFCDLRSIFTHFRVPPPEIDQLILNYRSHQKILELSHRGIVRPLEQAFPYAIDSLEPDMGHRDGPRPIVVNDGGLAELAKHLFNLDGASTGIAFGASQCVLVRSEEAKESLPEELSKALVLTIEQSKGLEFDDVILVNFFRDSTYHDWQVMKSFVEEDKGEPRKRPQFDRYRHTLLCSELKHLYVGVTRTRHVLLFIEQDPAQGQHTFEFWRKQGLVTFGLMEQETQDALDQLMDRAGEHKSEESWRIMGNSLLGKQLFAQAKSAFERAKDATMVTVCEAYVLALRAEQAEDDSETECVRLYLEAASMFCDVGHGVQRAICLRNAGHHLEAAEVFESLGPDSWESAALAFESAGQPIRASGLYLRLEDFIKALDCLTQADAHDDIKRVVLHAHKTGKLSVNDCFRYLQDLEAHDVAAELFLREGNFVRAASCFQTAGLPNREAECYMRSGQEKEAADIWSRSCESLLIRQAADLYVNMGEHEKGIACYKNLVQLDPQYAERHTLLAVCAEYHEKCLEWSQAGDMWEQIGKFAAARTAFHRASRSKDVARMFELELHSEEGRLWSAQERETTQTEVAKIYEEVHDWEAALRLWELLTNWPRCASIAEEQGWHVRASTFYERAGEHVRAAESLIRAHEFESALMLLQELPEPHQALEIKCLNGLERHIEAARKQMAMLPFGDDAHTSEQRKQQALDAFSWAKKNESEWPSFLVQYKNEMPDSATSNLYLFAAGATCELIEQFQTEGDRMSAAAVASLSGDVCTAVDELRTIKELSGRDRDNHILDVLRVAALSAPRDKGQQSAMERTINELTRDSSCNRSVLELVSALIQKQKRTVNKKYRKQTAMDLTSAFFKKSREVSAGLRFQMELEIALAEGASFDDLGRALYGCYKVARDVEPFHEDIYCVHPTLHQHLFALLNECCAELNREAFLADGRDTLIVPAAHPLSRHGKQDEYFPKVVRICNVKSAHLETLLDRIEELLQRTVWTDAKDMVKVPDLWKRAKPLMKAERLDRWEAGYIDVVKGACTAAYDMKMTLSGVVKTEVPEQAKKLWDRTITKAKDALGSIGDECVPAMEELDGVIEALVKMYTESVSHDRVAQVDRGHKTVAEDVAGLVLEKVAAPTPICLTFMEFGLCQNARCVRDHPWVRGTGTANPRFLLNTELKKKARNPNTVGIGLPAWMELRNLCWNFVNKACDDRRCQKIHPPRDIVDLLQKEVGDVGKETFDKMAGVMRREAQRKSAAMKPIPEGFGFCFMGKPHLIMCVRLEALLASVLMRLLSFDACRPYLFRMCKAVYRLPDGRAAEYATKTLLSLHPWNLSSLSDDVSYLVDMPPCRSLLLEIVGSCRGAAAPKKIVQRPQAPTKSIRDQLPRSVVPRKLPIGAAPTLNKWTQKGGVDLFDQPQVQVTQPRVWVESSATGDLAPAAQVNVDVDMVPAEAPRPVENNSWRPSLRVSARGI